MITHQMKFCLLVFLAVTILVLAGCGGIPKDALKLTSESLQKRVLQTRKYEGVSEVDLLLASAGAIQDLGFNIDESEIELGLIVGSKERDATEIGQELLNIGCLLAGAFSGQPSSGIATDDHQEFRVSLVVFQNQCFWKGRKYENLQGADGSDYCIYIDRIVRMWDIKKSSAESKRQSSKNAKHSNPCVRHDKQDQNA